MQNIDPNKWVQIINFFAQKEGGQIDYLKVLKLVFLVDKFMLRHYGRMLTNDRYCALEHGPIPSQLKDVAHGIVSDRTSGIEFFPVSEEYCLTYLRHSSKNDWGIESVADFDTDLFSRAEIDAMEKVYKEFGAYSKWDLRDITHEFYEWKRHRIDENKKSAPMDIIDFFSDSNVPELDAFFNPDIKDVEVKRKFYESLELAKVRG